MSVDWRANYEKQLARLNPYQLAIVESCAACVNDPTPIRVIAAAGAGKTASTVVSISHVLALDLLQPEEIYVTTFTNKAAGELKERLEKVVDPKLFPRLRVGTWHALAGRYLREKDPRPPRHRWNNGFNVSIGERVPKIGRLWGQILGWQEVQGVYEGRGGQLAKGLDLENRGYEDLPNAKAYALAIDNIRSRGLNSHDPEGIQRAEALQGEYRGGKYKGEFPHLLDAWRLYERAKEGLGAFDFEDVLHRYWELGTDSARLILVDEAQDNSWIQLDTARKLARIPEQPGTAQPKGKLFLIGDVRQAIYSWRAADPEIMLHADKTLGASTLEIPTNYRSGRQIVEVGNEVSRGQSWSVGSDAVPARRDRNENNEVVAPDGLVRLREDPSSFEEAQSTAREIRELLDGEPLPKPWCGPHEVKADALQAAKECAIQKLGGGKWTTVLDTENEKSLVSDSGKGIRTVRNPDGTWNVLQFVPPSEIYVLVRTNKATAPYEMACLLNKVPVMVLGANTSFFDRFEIQDALAYCQLSGQIEVPAVGADVRPPQMGRLEAILRVWKRAPKPGGRFRYMRKAEAEQALERGFRSGAGRPSSEIVYDALRPLVRSGRNAAEWQTDLDDLVGDLQAIEGSTWAGRPADVLTQDPGEPGTAALVARILGAAEEEEEETDGEAAADDPNAGADESSKTDLIRAFAAVAKQFNSYAELVEFAQKLSKWVLAVSNLANLSDEERERVKTEMSRRVIVSTCHKVKGLQARYVYVSATASEFPHWRAASSPSRLAEEQRLFYVAVTRAADVCTLTNAAMGMRGSKPVVLGPSMFTAKYVRPYLDKERRAVLESQAQESAPEVSESPADPMEVREEPVSTPAALPFMEGFAVAETIFNAIPTALYAQYDEAYRTGGAWTQMVETEITRLGIRTNNSAEEIGETVYDLLRNAIHEQERGRVDTREIWQIPYEEFIAIPRNERIAWGTKDYTKASVEIELKKARSARPDVDWMPVDSGDGRFTLRGVHHLDVDDKRRIHAEAVKDAVKAGKPVPAEVLADFQDLLRGEDGYMTPEEKAAELRAHSEAERTDVYATVHAQSESDLTGQPFVWSTRQSKGKLFVSEFESNPDAAHVSDYVTIKATDKGATVNVEMPVTVGSTKRYAMHSIFAGLFSGTEGEDYWANARNDFDAWVNANGGFDVTAEAEEAAQEPVHGGVVGRYLTRSGKVGAEIWLHRSPDGSVWYRYSGEWGAGSGHNADFMRREVKSWLAHKRGVQIEIDFLAHVGGEPDIEAGEWSTPRPHVGQEDVNGWTVTAAAPTSQYVWNHPDGRQVDLQNLGEKKGWKFYLNGKTADMTPTWDEEVAVEEARRKLLTPGEDEGRTEVIGDGDEKTDAEWTEHWLSDDERPYWRGNAPWWAGVANAIDTFAGSDRIWEEDDGEWKRSYWEAVGFSNIKDHDVSLKPVSFDEHGPNTWVARRISVGERWQRIEGEILSEGLPLVPTLEKVKAYAVAQGWLDTEDDAIQAQNKAEEDAKEAAYRRAGGMILSALGDAGGALPYDELLDILRTVTWAFENVPATAFEILASEGKIDTNEKETRYWLTDAGWDAFRAGQFRAVDAAGHGRLFQTPGKDSRAAVHPDAVRPVDDEIVDTDEAFDAFVSWVAQLPGGPRPSLTWKQVAAYMRDHRLDMGAEFAHLVARAEVALSAESFDPAIASTLMQEPVSAGAPRSLVWYEPPPSGDVTRSLGASFVLAAPNVTVSLQRAYAVDPKGAAQNLVLSGSVVGAFDGEVRSYFLVSADSEPVRLMGFDEALRAAQNRWRTDALAERMSRLDLTPREREVARVLFEGTVGQPFTIEEGNVAVRVPNVDRTRRGALTARRVVLPIAHGAPNGREVIVRLVGLGLVVPTSDGMYRIALDVGAVPVIPPMPKVSAAAAAPASEEPKKRAKRKAGG